MILTIEHLKEKIPLIKGYTLVLYKHKKEYEVKIIDDFTSEYLIIDNDFISNKPLKLKDYIPLCKDIIEKLIQGYNLSQLSIQ